MAMEIEMISAAADLLGVLGHQLKMF